MSLLPQTIRRVDEIAARAQSAGRAPSLALAVLRDGEVLNFTGVGDHPVPDPNLQYRLGSITKTMTATLVMQLRDEGFFALDDLLYRHLPGTPIGGVTLRQLLGHVSGLQREPDGPWWERNTGGGTDKLLAELGYDKLSGPPFRRYRYSNLAYGLLGAVLERVTGETWADLVRERVLDPLAMKHTTYAPTEPFARGYVVHALDGSLHEEPRLDSGAMAPAGQLWSTVTDMAKWAAFLTDPAPTILPRETVDEMCSPVAISDLESWTKGYGLGLQLFRAGDRIYAGHSGSMPGYLAHLAVHRRSRLGVIAFANTYGLTGMHLRTVALDTLTAVLDAEPTPPAPWRPTPQPTGETAEVTGRWWWMGREHDIQAIADDTIDLNGPYHWSRFVREAPDRWRGTDGENEGETLTVLRDPEGQATRLDIATFIFSRNPWDLA